MTGTLFYVKDHVIPAAFSLLPERMHGPRATAMLLAIALQESGLEHRRQLPRKAGGKPGPARGLWQAEPTGGCILVLSHPATAKHLAPVLTALRYPPSRTALYEALEHNDVLACVLARLLLWTDPAPLPGPHDYDMGWTIYNRQWRPGQARPEKWRGCYGVAFDLVTS